MKLRSTTGINTGDKEFLTFWVRSSNGGNLQYLQARLYGLYNTPINGPLSLGDYLLSSPSNAWIPIVIPLEDFFDGGQWVPVESVSIISSISNLGMVYFDDIAIAKKVFRMPVPSGKRWQLTMSPGNRQTECEYDAGADQSHTDPPTSTLYNYHSFDINDYTLENTNEYNVPVSAVGDGTVVEGCWSQFCPAFSNNGYYVAINHGDGYQSRYLHFAGPPSVSLNQSVVVGQQIGVLGGTGYVIGGPHLHIGFRYNGSGGQSVSQLDLIRVEGLPIKSFTTECAPSRYYSSSPYWW
ncbi:MAG: M23 family metallopeptidase [Patescibacteria group bacterium]